MSVIHPQISYHKLSRALGISRRFYLNDRHIFVECEEDDYDFPCAVVYGDFDAGYIHIELVNAGTKQSGRCIVRFREAHDGLGKLLRNLPKKNRKH